MIEELDRIALEQDVARAAVALAWVLAHPSGAIPIVGTQRVSRIKESVAAVRVKLTRADWNRILEAAQGEPLP